MTLIAVVLALAGCGGDREGGGTDTDGSTVTNGGGTTGGETDTTETGGTTEPERRCDEKVGTVRGYIPVIERDVCDPRVLLRGDWLYSVDQLTTGPVGRLEFELGRLDLCTTWPGTVLVVRPDEETLVRLVDGTIACTATPGGEQRIETPGAEIRVHGTVFTLMASGGETTVRVHQGSLEVRATAGSADPVQVSELKQVVASEGQVELRPATYQVDAVESEQLTALRLGVVSLPSDALAAFTAGAAADVTVVTETDEQSKHLVEKGIVERFQPLTTRAIAQRSGRPLGLRSDTVVGVGTFTDLAPAFARLRAALGTGATLIYTPFAFPETTTDTTGAETEPAARETVPTETAPP